MKVARRTQAKCPQLRPSAHRNVVACARAERTSPITILPRHLQATQRTRNKCKIHIIRNAVCRRRDEDDFFWYYLHKFSH